MEATGKPKRTKNASAGRLALVDPSERQPAIELAESLGRHLPGSVQVVRTDEIHDVLARGTFGAVVIVGDPGDAAVTTLASQVRSGAAAVGVLVVDTTGLGLEGDLALAAGAHEVIASNDPAEVLAAAKRAVLRHQYTAMNTAVDVDPLTGLMSRSRVLSALEGAFRRCAGRPSGVGVIYADIDRFKSINDTFGHAAGDILLARVGERLRSAIGEGAVRAGRLGGDEFLVLVEGLCVETLAAAVAQRISSALEAPFEIEGERLRVQVSMGVATNDGAEDPLTVLRRADAALYRSKRDGRNRTSVADEGEDNTLIGVRERLAEALREDDLLLRTSLRMSINGGTVTARCYEAHWHDGEQSSGELETIAAEAGLMLSLNRWIIRAAITDAARHRDRCSVRLSGGLLSTQGLVEWIEALLAATGVAPGRLELLVDEAELSLEDDVLANIQALNDLGVLFGIDRFASTVGSLGFLAHAHVDTIVLASSLVEGCSTDRGRSAIIQGVTLTAQALGATIVAPRLADLADRDVLIRSGCDEHALPRHPALVALAQRRQANSVGRAREWAARPPRIDRPAAVGAGADRGAQDRPRLDQGVLILP